MAGKTNRDTGLVLRTVKLGDSDRIVTLLTCEHGKIKGVAKGARKSGSKYSARLEVGSVVDFQWISSNKELVRITQIETAISNRHLRENLDLINKTARMLDVIDTICVDNSSHKDLAIMAIKALSTMNETKSVNVCSVFLVKLLLLEGLIPEVDSCPICLEDNDLNYFSVSRASFFCKNHANSEMFSASPGTRDAIKAIISKKSGSVIENIPIKLADELESIAIAMIEYHSGSRLRAVLV